MHVTHPATSLRKLSALRARERLIVVFWGMVRWLTLAVAVLVTVCCIDWLVDRYGSLQARSAVRGYASMARRDLDFDISHERENRVAINWLNHFTTTPGWLRVGCSLLLFGTLLISAWYWLIRPWSRAPSLETLAVRAEKAYPRFDHRLVTAIQLTRRDAQTKGMSVQLIDMVSNESEDLADRHDLNRLANYSLLKKAGLLLLVPIIVFTVALFAFGAERFGILVQRQAFADVEIPRRTSIADQSRPVYVSDEEVLLTFEVTGKLPRDDKGTLIVIEKDGSCPEYEIKLDKKFDDKRATYVAKVKASENFKYRAWFGDGRTLSWKTGNLVARPQVTIHAAYMIMPGYVPESADGTRLEILQRHGDVRLYPPSEINRPLYPSWLFMGNVMRVPDPGSLARIRVHVQKPVADVKLTLMYQRLDDQTLFPIRTIPMKYVGQIPPAWGSQEVERPFQSTSVTPEGYYEGVFSADFAPLIARAELKGLRNGEVVQVNRYRVSAVDEYGFESRRDPQRSITVDHPDPPQVELLPERYPRSDGSITEEDIIKDLPIPPGEKVKLEYIARSSIGFPDPIPGLGNRLNSPARLMVRVNEEETPRIYLLDEIPETIESGEYDLQRAAFRNQPFMERAIREYNGVPFHGKPGGGPANDMPRREAGGVYYFNTKDLKKTALDGTLKDLEVGDSLEFWFEVTDRAGNRLTEKNSPKRRKEIRSVEEVYRQSVELLESESKLRSIEKRQRELGQGLIGQPKKK